ncbi:MAG TPA: tetratricopeptide repeat protein, partial [Kofleriaceae bacterium]|nr:tetratricopeptide repeat protein [Kofleriaceae bacterium]
MTVLVASTGVARAGDKYKRTPAVNVTVNFSDRVKPVQPHASTAAPQPGLDADAVLDLEGRLGSVRGEQEQILLDLIQQTPDRDVDEKCDYYFRLAELYAKQQRYFRLEAAKAQIAADKDPKHKAELDKLAASNAARSHQYLVAAVRTYKALADNDLFRNYPKMDMALFYYGYTLQSGAYVKEARAVYDKLLASYPSSKYVPEAHLAFADYFFENNQLDDAEARYKQVLEFPHASVYWYAMYKMGWIHLNKQRFQEALETFYQVALATRGDRKQVILNRAAKKDFVRAYAEIGKADQAWNAFKRVDAGYALDMLQILADLYLEQGKSDRAIYTYRDLMKREPTSASVCQWQYDVAHAMLSMPGASNADKVGEIENLTHLWRALASRPLPAAAKQECHDDAAAMSGELARAYHSESVRTLNVETFGYAERLYRAYLDAFPDADDFAQTQYFYAELQWSRATLERDARRQVALWQRAANAFTDVVKLGKVEPRLLKESAYAAVLGWKNALDIDPRPKQQAADDDPKAYTVKPEPLPIPEPDQKMIAAFELYITYVKDPKDPDVVGMKFSEANTLRRYNHFREAIPIFEDIVFHHAEHEAAPTAANLLLDIYNRQQNYDDMLALVDKLSALPLGKTDELAPVLAKLRAQSLEKRAQLLEKQGKFVACGLAYEDIYNTKPEDPGNDVVLYNAGTCFEEGKSIGAAIKMFDTLERYYASSKLAARALARLGKDYADLAFYDQAAERYEQYAKKFAGEKDAFDVLSDATMFRKGTGADDKAIADTKYFVD